MGTAVFSTTPQRAWTVASGNTTSGTSQYFQKLSDATANALSDPKRYTFRNTQWTSELATSSSDTTTQYIAIDLPVDQGNVVALKFFGRPAASYSPIITPRRGIGAIWGISEVVSGGNTEYLGEYLGQFSISIGNTEATNSDVFTETTKPFFARRGMVTVDRAAFPGLREVGDFQLTRDPDSPTEADPVSPSPLLLVDGLGYHQMVVELRGMLPIGAEKQEALELGFAYRMV